LEAYNQLFSNSKPRGSKRFENSDAQALQYMQTHTPHGRMLKFADQIIRFPKKERFNQDLEESIKEIKNRMDQPKSSLKGLDTLSNQNSFDLRSKMSLKSKQSR